MQCMKVYAPVSWMLIALFLACTRPGGGTDYESNLGDTVLTAAPKAPITIITGSTTPAEVTDFAKTLNGIPYKYASINPADGFDCSGFITYVFNHFGISVPRSSVDFTTVQREVKEKEAKPGDLVLFTGTDSTTHIVGHMGIVLHNGPAGFIFIHSTSGRANGVTETLLNDDYQHRYVKTVRVFPQNDQ
ncbi:C40 family peptidase [Mucilaginibacter sp. HMF5004]|uniref:C40 family peptidase n=1 Tax=Mucilaginibacter rivuli TaxID=2857527 RepID=UPI001C5E3694|nr:C40 family peptidase [Mucilaginibacter rivuli]MBW4888177.1 C40 family peptidase [Mucilaginibacter rivuli]